MEIVGKDLLGEVSFEADRSRDLVSRSTATREIISCVSLSLFLCRGYLT